MFTDVFSRFIIRDTAIAKSDEDNKNKGGTKMPLKDKQQMENNPNVYTIFLGVFFLIIWKKNSAFVDLVWMRIDVFLKKKEN